MRIKTLALFLVLGSPSLFSQAFITTWKTDNPGVSEDNQITIPIASGASYDYNVDWGDGTTDEGVTTSITHAYSLPGTYEVAITGTYPRIFFQTEFDDPVENDAEKLISVNQWGDQRWTSMRMAFSGCLNLDVVATDVPDLTNVTDFADMFRNCSSLIGNPSFNQWDVSSMVGAFAMFSGATQFNQDISNWNVGNLVNTGAMFHSSSFNQDIGNWDVGNVRFMGSMFAFTPFNQDIGSWNVSQVTNMGFMFQAATSFNQDISNWDVSNVTDMLATFDAAASFNQSLNTWNVSNVTNMFAMFAGATSFNQPLDNWDVSSVTDMINLFRGATSFDQDLGNWNVGQVVSMIDMFREAGLSQENYDSTLNGWADLPSLQNDVPFNAGNSIYCAGESSRLRLINEYGWVITDAGKDDCPFITTWKTDNLGVSNDNQITIPTFQGETYDYAVDWGDGNSDANVTGDITHTYLSPGTYQVSISGDFPRIYFNDEGDKSKLLFIDQWGDIIWSSMENAFWGCQNMDIGVSDVPDLSNVTSMRLLFKDCASLIGDGIVNWDVSTIQDFSNLFDSATIFNQDLNDWDVSNVRNMNDVFHTAINFNGNISDWNVSNVIFMSNMFRQAFAFNQDVSAWDVSQVSNFSNMFNGATVFNQDLSGWDLGNAESLSGMFGQAIAFNQDIGNWNVSNVTNMGGLFWRAEAFNTDISNWDVSNVTDMIAMFSEASAFDQNIGDWDISNVARMEDMFFNTGLSLENYDSMLSSWAGLSNLQNNVVFNAGDSRFCESSDERQFIIDTYGWTITDGGEAPLCNEDNDGDGVLDHKDLCLDTPSGVSVNPSGCDLIPNDAIQVLVLTPSCTDSSDGSIEVSMNAMGYLLDISLEGEGITNQFLDVASGNQFDIDDLPVGTYTITISIPEILFERVFGVTVNSLESVSGKRQVLDTRARTVSYVVSGSKNYTVSVNGENQHFQFEDSGPQTIFMENLDGETNIIITGENDCQGKIEDNFFVEDSISVFPTVVSDTFNVISASGDIELVIYGLSGAVVQPMESLEFSNREAKVDVSLLPSGLYLVNLVEGKNVKTVKIIKR
tara:strand:+ start:5074 stop:8304 length:3231 start_codon:yes stop_codon:yes gene_type:complete